MQVSCVSVNARLLCVSFGSHVRAVISCYDCATDITVPVLLARIYQCIDLAGLLENQWRNLFGISVRINPATLELRYAPTADASDFVSLRISDTPEKSSSDSVVGTVSQALNHLRETHGLRYACDMPDHDGCNMCLSNFVFAAETLSAPSPCSVFDRLLSASRRTCGSVLPSAAVLECKSQDQNLEGHTISRPKCVYQSPFSVVADVSLTNIGLHDGHGPCVMEALMFADTLRVLDIRNNMLGDGTAQWLLTASDAAINDLRGWQHLTHFLCEGNLFSAEYGLPALFVAASKWNTLCGFSASCVPALRTRLQTPANSSSSDARTENDLAVPASWCDFLARLQVFRVDWGCNIGSREFWPLHQALAPFLAGLLHCLPNCHALRSMGIHGLHTDALASYDVAGTAFMKWCVASQNAGPLLARLELSRCQLSVTALDDLLFGAQEDGDAQLGVEPRGQQPETKAVLVVGTLDLSQTITDTASFNLLRRWLSATLEAGRAPHGIVLDDNPALTPQILFDVVKALIEQNAEPATGDASSLPRISCRACQLQLPNVVSLLESIVVGEAPITLDIDLRNNIVPDDGDNTMRALQQRARAIQGINLRFV